MATASARPHDPASYPPDVLAGQGMAAISGASSRTSGYHRVLTAMAEGTPTDDELARWVTATGGDPLALRNVLDSLVPTPAAALHDITMPTLVVVGDQDHDHSSADTLAGALPNARFARVPGNHFTAITNPEFMKVTLAFLGE